MLLLVMALKFATLDEAGVYKLDEVEEAEDEEEETTTTEGGGGGGGGVGGACGNSGGIEVEIDAIRLLAASLYLYLRISALIALSSTCKF